MLYLKPSLFLHKNIIHYNKKVMLIRTYSSQFKTTKLNQNQVKLNEIKLANIKRKKIYQNHYYYY